MKLAALLSGSRASEILAGGVPSSISAAGDGVTWLVNGSQSTVARLMIDACWWNTFLRKFASVAAKRPSREKPRKRFAGSFTAPLLRGLFLWMSSHWHDRMLAAKQWDPSADVSALEREIDQHVSYRHIGVRTKFFHKVTGVAFESSPADLPFGLDRTWRIQCSLPPLVSIRG